MDGVVSCMVDGGDIQYPYFFFAFLFEHFLNLFKHVFGAGVNLCFSIIVHGKRRCQIRCCINMPVGVC